MAPMGVLQARAWEAKAGMADVERRRRGLGTVIVKSTFSTNPNFNGCPGAPVGCILAPAAGNAAPAWFICPWVGAAW